VVSWFGAIQGQDYAGAQWSIGLRMRNITQEDIERAINEARIVRCWPVRGTLHLVSANDVRWINELVRPHIVKMHSPHYRSVGLEPQHFAKSWKVLERFLRDGNRVTREELKIRFGKSGIPTDNERLSLLLYRAGVENLICFGPRQGKQFTYTLVDEWIPKGARFTAEESLALLTTKYFQSRGPATLEDFVWWSSLPSKTAREGIELVQKNFRHEKTGNRMFILPGNTGIKFRQRPTYLLPGFDEYILGYTDRSDVVAREHVKTVRPQNAVFAYTVLLQGKVAGIWKRTVAKQGIMIDIQPFVTLTDSNKKAIVVAAKAYGKFMRMAVNVSFGKKLPGGTGSSKM
jgi:hypothetical protein